MQEMNQRTGGQLRLGPGTLCGAIKRLVTKGMLAEAEERPDPELDGERRRYYRLMDFGQRVLRAEAACMARLVRQEQDKELWPDVASIPAPGM